MRKQTAQIFIQSTLHYFSIPGGSLTIRPDQPDPAI